MPTSATNPDSFPADAEIIELLLVSLFLSGKQFIDANRTAEPVLITDSRRSAFRSRFAQNALANI